MLATLIFITYFASIQGKLNIESDLTPKFTCLETLLLNWWGKINIILAERLENLDILEDFDYVPPHVAIIEPHIEKSIKALDEKANCYFIAFSSLDFLERLLQIILESEIFKLASYIVVADSEVNLQLVAEILWNYRLPHSLLLQLNNNDKTLNIHSIKILDCGGAVVPEKLLTLHEQTNCDSLEALAKFDFKKSFSGCPLNVLWSHYPPFVYPPDNPHGWRGIFIDFLEPLAGMSERYLTFSSNDSDYYEEISKGFTFDAVIQDMQNETELFIGPTELRTYSIFHLSTIITNDDFVLISPRPLRNYLGDFASVRYLKYLIGGVVVFGVSGVLLLGLNNVESYNKNQQKGLVEIWIVMFGYLLGASTFGYIPPKRFLRMFLAVLLFNCLILNIYFQGSLLRAFTGSVYGPPYSTLQLLIKSNLRVKMPELTGNFLKSMAAEDKDVSSLMEHYEPFEEGLDMWTNIDKLIEDRNYATCAIKAILLMKPNYGKMFGTFTFFKINLGLAMKKDDFSAPPLHKWIGRMLEVGILEKYENIHFAQLAWKFSLDPAENIYVLTLEKLKPVLYIYFVVCVVCFVILILEILYFNLSSLIYSKKVFKNGITTN